jgi:molybdate transport system ATP-binding protein
MADPRGAPLLEFSLRKRLGGFSLRVEAAIGAEWLVLLAPSGAGKSLTLNLLAGLMTPDAGQIRLEGRTLYDGAAGVSVPIRKRRMGYLFQDYALFPHLTVSANVAYGVPAGTDARAEVARWLALLHIQEKAGAYPRELSGGQRQRAALARTLASRPRLLLLDEPFSALDRPIRERLQGELLALKARLDLPVILVTHDFNEARVLADRVAVLEQGQVLEVGEKERMFRRPRRHATAGFLGVENLWPATVTGAAPGGGCRVRAGPLELDVADGDGPQEGVTHLCCYAADVRLVFGGPPRPNSLSGAVTQIVPDQGSNRVRVQPAAAGAPEVVSRIDDYVLRSHGLRPGSAVTLWLPPDKLFLCG